MTLHEKRDLVKKYATESNTFSTPGDPVVERILNDEEAMDIVLKYANEGKVERGLNNAMLWSSDND